jgi:hypothetical protein
MLSSLLFKEVSHLLSSLYIPQSLDRLGLNEKPRMQLTGFYARKLFNKVECKVIKLLIYG